jgi:hypothetical protein
MILRPRAVLVATHYTHYLANEPEQNARSRQSNFLNTPNSEGFQAYKTRTSHHLLGPTYPPKQPSTRRSSGSCAIKALEFSNLLEGVHLGTN